MTLPPDTIRYLVYALAAAAAILVVEVLYLQVVRRRNRGAVNRRLRKAAEGDENLMPLLIEAVESHVTLGEIAHELRKVFGLFKESITL